MARKIEDDAHDPRLHRIEGIAGTKVHLNDADREELQGIDGVDGVRAAQLIEHRSRNGAIHSWDELEALPAFDPLTIEAMRSRATLA